MLDCWCKRKFNIWEAFCKTLKNQFWSFWVVQRWLINLNLLWTCLTLPMKWSSEVVWDTLSCNKSLDINSVLPESCFQKIQDFSMKSLKRLKARELKCTLPATASQPERWSQIQKPRDLNSLKDLMLISKVSISDQIQELDSVRLSREQTQFSGTVQSVFSKFLSSETVVRQSWDTSLTEPKKVSAQSSAVETQSA